jgi:putative transposase
VNDVVNSRRLLADSKDTAAVCRELGVSEATYHRWRNQFGGLKAEAAKRLKDLERENATLKRLLANAELEYDALRHVGEIAFQPPTSSSPPRYSKFSSVMRRAAEANTT